MNNFVKIPFLLLFVLAIIFSNKSIALVNYNNVTFECTFDKKPRDLSKFQIHRKSSSNMYFQEYDIKSTSFKETHNKIIWSYTKTGGNANSKLYDK